MRKYDHWREPEPPPLRLRPPCLQIFPTSLKTPTPICSRRLILPRPGAVAGTLAELVQAETQDAAMKSELRLKNARLREKINSILERHPELRDVTDEIALKQGSRVRVGTPFLDRIEANLQERARAIIERRPDLEHLFDD